MKINLVTILFGKEFVTKYINYCLPSLLANENLPAVIGKHSVNYTIYCPLSDFNIIKESQVFKKIRSLGNNAINIKQQNISNNYIENDPSGHLFAWQKSMSEAVKKNECLIFVIPDNIFSNNCISKWVQLIEDGYTQILAPSPYVLEESSKKIINNYKNNSNGIIKINQEDILNIYKNNIHPLSGCMEEGQTIINTHPEHRIRIKEKKIVIRTITSNPLVLNFSKKEKKIVVDQIRSISLESINKYSKFGILLPKTIREKFNYGPWLNIFLNEDCAIEFQYEHNIEFKEKDIQYNLIKSSNKFYKWALSVKDLHKLAKELNSGGCLISACLMLEMVRYKPNQMQELYKKSICIVCPKDKLINENTKYKILSLLQTSNHNEMLEMMKNFFINKDEGNEKASIFFGIGNLKRLKINSKSVYILEEVNSPKWSKIGMYFTDNIKKESKLKNNKIIEYKERKFESRDKIKKLISNILEKLISVTVVFIIEFGKYIPNVSIFSRQVNILYKINRFKNEYGVDKLNNKINEYLKNIIKSYLYKLISKIQQFKDLKSKTNYKQINYKIINRLKLKALRIIPSVINLLSLKFTKTNIDKKLDDVYKENLIIISWEILKFSNIKRGCSLTSSYNYIDNIVNKNFFEKYNNQLIENKYISEENKLAIAVTLLNNNMSKNHGLQFISTLITKKIDSQSEGENKELLLRAVLAAARVYMQLNEKELAEKCYIFAIKYGKGNAITSKDRVNFREQNIKFPDSFQTLYNNYSYFPKQIF